MGTSGDADEAWVRAWMATFRTLQAAATTVTLLEDTPYPGTNVPECLSGHMFDATACNLDEDEAMSHPGQRRMLHDAVRQAGIGTVDPTGWFCRDGICPASVGNTVVYRDSSHITPEYAAVLAPFLQRALARP